MFNIAGKYTFNKTGMRHDVMFQKRQYNKLKKNQMNNWTSQPCTKTQKTMVKKKYKKKYVK